MTVVPFVLTGAQNALAIATADLLTIQAEGFERPKELQIAISHLLGGLGESLYDYQSHDHLNKVYVAQEGKRVVTLCFRRKLDSGTLQVVYDSQVDPT